MSGLDPLGLQGNRELLGNGIGEWGLLFLGVVLTIINLKLWPFLILVSIPWLKNFFFWITPAILFSYFHHRAYNKNLTLGEYLELRRWKKINKRLEKENKVMNAGEIK